MDLGEYASLGVDGARSVSTASPDEVAGYTYVEVARVMGKLELYDAYYCAVSGSCAWIKGRSSLVMPGACEIAAECWSVPEEA